MIENFTKIVQSASNAIEMRSRVDFVSKWFEITFDFGTDTVRIIYDNEFFSEPLFFVFRNEEKSFCTNKIESAIDFAFEQKKA